MVPSKGCAGRACFPAAPTEMIKVTMPEAHDIVRKAEAELDGFADFLEIEGIKVYCPSQEVDWLAEGGYTGAMPRDGLLRVGNILIEACLAWSCRSREIEIGVTVIRRPPGSFADTLLRDDGTKVQPWVINNSRPAFDAADFMRLGKNIMGRYSHVTNRAGVKYLQENLPAGYTIEPLDVNGPSAMHIDATILPLCQGLLGYNPNKVTEAALRARPVLADWDLRPYPFVPKKGLNGLPLFMTSPWLVLTALVLDGERVVVEAGDEKTARWFEELGMRCPFKHVNSLRGSFHCATVDPVRRTVAN
ncbi:hypothetical protein BDW69DRAFT_200617 [Aspergillus filifer]